MLAEPFAHELTAVPLAMRTIYLDYNATTPIAPSVQEAMLPFLAEHYGNPSSGHALGRACREAIEDARTRIASLLGAAREEILFTSGGTESNNLALKGIAWKNGLTGRRHLVISAIEHPAVSEVAKFLARNGFSVSTVGCDAQGVVHPDAVEEALRGDTLLASIMHANNEIGTIQPVRAIAAICHRHGVLVHTDAAQSVGKIPTRVAELDVDLLSIAGHKLYAPKGVGALYVRPGLTLEPVLHGAGHEGALRSGTENVASIVGMGRAAALAERSLDEAAQRMADMRDRLLARLRAALGEAISVNGRGAERLPNTLSVNFHGHSGSDLLRRAPELCASTGAACHAGEATRSATQAAIGLSPERARGTVRLSVGWYTDEDDVERAADLLIASCDCSYSESRDVRNR